jgi:CheY-like chemotaxis protein
MDRRPKTVLIVEDDAIQSTQMRVLLEKAGLLVLCAPNGVKGIQLTRSCRPDVIILDVEMPEMGGLEVCQILKRDQHTAFIPIIFLTGHTDVQTMMRGLEGGAIDYIPKDAFSNRVLLETLRQLYLLDAPEDELQEGQ